MIRCSTDYKNFASFIEAETLEIMPKNNWYEMRNTSYSPVRDQ